MDMERSLTAISVKVGRLFGSDDQHSPISFFHSKSQRSGTGGRRVSFKMPP